MKKTVLTYGLIAGAIVSLMIIILMGLIDECAGIWGMVLNYTGQVAAFVFIFVAVKKYRDNEGNGLISFGKAFKIGLYISLIASSMYVVTWLIDYYFFIPDFMDKYAAMTMEKVKASGASAADIEATAKQMEEYKEIYKNPAWVTLFTYFEILPTGLLASLLAAAFLKKNNKTPMPA